MTTWGDKDDFRHFLPRLFELLAHDDEFRSHADPQIVLGKLGYGKWQNWPIQERTAIEDYLVKLWAFQLETSEPGNEFDMPEAEDWIEGIAQAVDDLSPYLLQWQNASSLNSALNLAQFVIFNSDRLDQETLGLAFLEDRVEQDKQIRKWLLSEPVIGKLRSLEGLEQEGERFRQASQYLRETRLQVN